MARKADHGINCAWTDKQAQMVDNKFPVVEGVAYGWGYISIMERKGQRLLMVARSREANATR